MNTNEAVGRQILKGIRAATQGISESQPRLDWKEAWTLRLTILGPGNRLPRGFKQRRVTKPFGFIQDEMPLYSLG